MMTCASCLHSVETADGILWCCQWGKVARQTCADFLYAPGSDESERDKRDDSDDRKAD